MGKAHQAPASHYTRRLVISAHAIERFRERVDEEFRARPDGDLGNLLDERVRQSKDRVEVIDNIAGGRTSTLVRIENRNGEVSYAVVRDDTVVSVLTDGMTQNNFNTGAWEQPMNTPFKNALKNVPVTPASSTSPTSISPPPVTVVAPAPCTLPGPADSVDAIALRLGRAMLALERAKLDQARLEVEVVELREQLAKQALVAAGERDA